MNYFLKQRWLSIAVAFLILANIATIVLFWTNRTRTQPPPFPPVEQRSGRAPTLLVRELDLDKQQQEQYDALFHEHREKIRTAEDSLHTAKEHLFDLLSTKEPADEEVKKRAAEAARLQERIDVLTFEHMMQVKAVCTPEQQKKFDKVIGEVLRRLAPPPPPPPPPHREEAAPPPPPGS